MQATQTPLEAFQSVLALPVVKALLWLILAFIVAAIVKSIVKGIMTRTRLKTYLSDPERRTEEDFNRITDYIATLAYFITFVLFVPAIFTSLGAADASQPLLGLLNDFWGYVPNIVGAVIVLVVGFLIARLVRELLVPALRKTKIDALQTKAGIEVSETASLSQTIAYIVYVLIIIPVVIVALQVLNISSISDPATGMLSKIFDYIPLFAVGIAIIALGVFIARLAGNIVGQLVASTGVDTKLNDAYDGKLGNVNLSKVVNYVVQAVIIIFFVVEGLNILHLDVLTNIGSAIVGYLPNVLAAFIIFALAALAAGLAGKAMRKSTFASYAPIAQVGIWVLAAFMVFTQLSIAPKIVNYAFIIILAAVGVAFAISFGIGGRDFANKIMGYWGKDIDAAREKKLATPVEEPEVKE